MSAIVRLTPNFTLNELVASETATRMGIDNTPSPAVRARLQNAAENMEEVRRILGGRPIVISSGYRCSRLNVAIGGASTSAHMSGDAIDFNCFAFGTPFEVCKALEGRLPYDQLIHEYGRWVHISFAPRLRRNVLTITKAGVQTGLHPV